VHVPLCSAETTGEWPSFDNPESTAKVSAVIFGFLNFARALVPVRIGLTLATAPLGSAPPRPALHASTLFRCSLVLVRSRAAGQCHALPTVSPLGAPRKLGLSILCRSFSECNGMVFLRAVDKYIVKPFNLNKKKEADQEA
jgi:hypothetical protein